MAKAVSPPKVLAAQTKGPDQPATTWGKAEKIADHTYRTNVGQDPVLGSTEEIFQALNAYRKNHGRQELKKDDKLCGLATTRAVQQKDNLDGHQGFKDYFADQSHWQELGVTGIGENSSWNYTLSGVHLIEWVFDADDEHRNNQLNPDWNLGCVGIAGTTVDVIFGKR